MWTPVWTSVGAGKLPPVDATCDRVLARAGKQRCHDEDGSASSWDREPDHVQPLRDRGAEIADTAEEVVSSAQEVITMLPTAEIVLMAVEPLLGDWPQQTIWLQMSSVGASEAYRLADVAAPMG